MASWLDSFSSLGLGGAQPRPSLDLAAGQVPAQTVGCALSAKMKTIIALGPRDVALTIEHAEHIASIAEKNNNVVVRVCLGVSSDEDATVALRLPKPRILLVGAGEIARLLQKDGKNTELSNDTREYLREAVLLDCVAGSAQGTDRNGHGGTWCLPSSPISQLSALNALEPREQLTFVEWKDKLNEQWSAWFSRFEDKTTPLSSADSELFDVYTATTVDLPPTCLADSSPTSGLPRNSVALAGRSPSQCEVNRTAPFAIVNRTVKWTGTIKNNDLIPHSMERWATTGGQPSLLISTYCSKTKSALQPAPMQTGRRLDGDDLRYEVRVTLASLFVSVHADSRDAVERMRGVLGPVVLAGRGGAQPMRVVWWTTTGAPSVLMLLPDAYVADALAVYNQRPESSPMLVAQGVLELRADEIVAASFPEMDEGSSEMKAEQHIFGTRLWKMGGAFATQKPTKKGGAFAKGGAPPRPNLDLGAAQVATRGGYVTELDNEDLLRDGLVGIDEQTDSSFVYTTCDALAGLTVRWVMGSDGELGLRGA